VPVQSWLERIYRKSLSELNLREQNARRRNRYRSGMRLPACDSSPCWIGERSSSNSAAWRGCFGWIHPGSIPRWISTRANRYRRAIEELARRSGEAEDQVVQRAIELSTQAAREAAEDDRRIHVGTYLMGEGRRELARLIRCHEAPRFRVLQWVYRHHSAVYFLGLSLFSAVSVSLIVLLGLRGQTPGIRLVIALLLLIPVSQLAIEVLNYLVMRLLPPEPFQR